MFGLVWDELPRPVTAIVDAIDENDESQIGLSAKQLRNLGLNRIGGFKDTNNLMSSVRANEKLLTDPPEFGEVIAYSRSKLTHVSVFNAWGHLSTGRADGIRVSSSLARDLNLHVGSKLKIVTDVDRGTGRQTPSNVTPLEWSWTRGWVWRLLHPRSGRDFLREHGQYLWDNLVANGRRPKIQTLLFFPAITWD